MKDREHDTAMAEVFRNDPAYAEALLNSILEDGDQGELLIALRQMAAAFGGVRQVAKAAALNPNQLYRTLSHKGNPEIRSLMAILRTMGLRLAIQKMSVEKQEQDTDIPEWAEAREKIPVRSGCSPLARVTRTAPVRLDPDILEYLHSEGDGWQDRLNALLREAIADKQKNSFDPMA